MDKMNSVELLRRKHELLKNMLHITENTKFRDEEDDAEKYIGMIEKREEIMKELLLIDQRLKALADDSSQAKGNDKPQMEARQLLAEIKKTAGQIISLDKAMADVVPRITEDLKKHMKGISAGKTLNSAYQSAGIYASYNDGSSFDTTK